MTTSSADVLDLAGTEGLTATAAIGIAMVTVRPGQVGGAESYARGLLKAYRTLAPCRIRLLANDEIAQAYASIEGGKLSIHSLKGFRVSGSGIGRASSLARAALLPGRLRRETPSDIAAVHYPVVVPLPRLRVPRIVTLHDIQHHDMPENFSRAMRTYRAIAYDAAARRADQVITDSEYSRTGLIKALGIAPDRVHAIHLGIDHGRFNPQPTDTDRAMLDRLDVPRRYVFYPANLWPHKNHELLLAAFARVKDSSAHLVLTGQRYAAGDAFDQNVRRHRLSGRVHHLGFVSSEALPALYRQAIGLVFPSRYEGFGAPPLEAMACGCPVAASGAASLGEICEGAVLTLDPEDEMSIATAIERLVEDQALRDKLREDGYARAARFTWHRAAEEHLKIYQLAAYQQEHLT